MFSSAPADRIEEPLAVARSLVFAPIGGSGLAEQAVRRLGEAIGLGLLEVGDRLPPEPELAVQLGIAPMTLRQALRILREAGYVETRRGRGGGTFVRRTAPPTPVRVARKRFASFTVDDLRDLTDYRAAIAGTCASLAAERAAQTELESLRHLVETMTAASRYREFRRADGRFHLSIAAAAKSRRLVAAETSIQTEMADLLALIPHPPEALRLSNGQHRAILEAISQRDAGGARALAEAHARGTGDFLIGLRLGQLGG